MIFRDAADAWIEAYKQDRAYTTGVVTEMYLRKRVLPAFGDLRLEEINREHVQSFAQSLSKDKLDRTTIEKMVRIVSMVFQFTPSIEDPTKGISYRYIPKRGRKKEIFEHEEVEKLIVAARPKWMGDLILLAYRTGMRRGEMFGLRWENVDFVRHRLYVLENAVCTKPGERIIKCPKTKESERVILLDHATMEMLNRRKSEAKPEGGIWVFEDQYGRPLSPWYVTKYMHEACKKIGIVPRGIHMLRHTHATYLLSKKVYIKTVQMRLGHSTPIITLGTYAHALAYMQEEAVNVLDDL